MKLLVTEMPYFVTECPFYDLGDGECRLMTEVHCEHFDPPCGERNLEECHCLITVEAYKNKEVTT